MSIFDQLEERDVGSLVEFIKTLSPGWQQRTNYVPAVAIADRPTWFDEPGVFRGQAEKGRQAFNQRGIACHGEAVSPRRLSVSSSQEWTARR